MTKTAKTYGGALYDLAKEENLTEQLRHDLELAEQMFREIPEYRKLLSEPSIPKEERKTLLDEAWKGRVHPYAVNFMNLLCDNGTIWQFTDCVQEYRHRYQQDNGILPVRAVSASALTQAQKDRLCKALKKKTGKEIELSLSVDAGLIGGMRLEYDGIQYDGSVRYHLQELEKLLQNTVL